MRVIELTGVSYSYGGGQDALEGISLSIESGDFLAFLGPNGSGKSTLLKIILGILPPSRGNVKLFGEEIKTFKDWSRIGYVPQQAFMLDKNFPATVREVVSTGLYAKAGMFHNLSAKDWETIDRQIRDAGLQESSEKLIGQLSGGQQQRTFIARALVNKPDILILDEPTTGIDENSENEFYQNLEMLNRNGVTIILVSHDISLVSTKVKSILCLDRHTLFHGDSKDFRELVAKNPGFLFGKNMAVMHHHH